MLYSVSVHRNVVHGADGGPPLIPRGCTGAKIVGWRRSGTEGVRTSIPKGPHILGRSRSGQVLDAEMHLSTSPKLPPLPREETSCHMSCMHATRGRPSPDGSEGAGRRAEALGEASDCKPLTYTQGFAATHCLSRIAGKPEFWLGRGVEFKARNDLTGLDGRERGVCHFCRQSQLSWCPREQWAAGHCSPPVADLALRRKLGNVGAHSSPFAPLQSPPSRQPGRGPPPNHIAL